MANKQTDILGISSIEPDPETTSQQNAIEVDKNTEGDQLKASADDLFRQAKETAGDSYDAVATKAKSKLEKGKNEFSTGLLTVADSVRQMGGQLQNNAEGNRVTDLTSKYSGKAAGALEYVANYFERKDLREVVNDTQDFARRNPAIFFGTAFALGLLAARFLKSSPPKRGALTSGSPVGQATRGIPQPATGSPRESRGAAQRGA